MYTFYNFLKFWTPFDFDLPTKMCIRYAIYLHWKSANRALNIVFFYALAEIAFSAQMFSWAITTLIFSLKTLFFFFYFIIMCEYLL